MVNRQIAIIKRLPSKNPNRTAVPAHWVGNPPQSFCNPWPSFLSDKGFLDILQIRFGAARKFIPVPEGREELVKVRFPDWSYGEDRSGQCLKATWLGHAGFLIETGLHPDITAYSSRTNDQVAEHNIDNIEAPRGIRALFDPLFSERTSPVTFAGPKRYTPTPCTISQLPDVDLIVISHDHYDHLDLASINQICRQQQARGSQRPHFLAGLGNAKHLLSVGADIEPTDITECDWWDTLEINVSNVGTVELTCTPSQHNSGRGIFDHGRSLWCSWCLHDPVTKKQLFFAGDTAYKAANAPSPCPAFKEIGEVFGGFDLALLPIGAFKPRDFMSNVHCSPEDSLEMHKDLKSRKSIGMHYGTVRGGLSMYYEDVRDGPSQWQKACEKEDKWATECGLCDVGETLFV